MAKRYCGSCAWRDKASEDVYGRIWCDKLNCEVVVLKEACKEFMEE